MSVYFIQPVTQEFVFDRAAECRMGVTHGIVARRAMPAEMKC